MIVVFPMCGGSRRFIEAGHDRRKFMLPLWGATMFDWVINGFKGRGDHLLFIVRGCAEEDRELPAFVAAACERQGISNYGVEVLQSPTAGQAETVERGLRLGRHNAEQPCVIFNIDTLRDRFELPNKPWYPDCDGYLEVFRGRGAQWSFVQPIGEGDRVGCTTEKKPVSDLCSTGLYFFRTCRLFLDALEAEKRSPQSDELYVAPLYNHLIRNGADVRYDLIARESVVFCGTPDEYENLVGAERIWNGSVCGRLE